MKELNEDGRPITEQSKKLGWQKHLWRLWPDEGVRTFTCHGCGAKRVLDEDAVRQEEFKDAEGKVVEEKLVLKPGSLDRCKCGRTITELWAFARRYNLLPPVPRQARKKKAEDRQLSWL